LSALLIVIGLLLGTAAPASIAAITTLQWVQLSLALAKGIPQVIKADQQVIAFIQSPAFRVMLAANGEAAIRWQDRQMEN
jgi:hypothetical protein